MSYNEAAEGRAVSSMQQPPGLVYLRGIIPYFFVPSIASYCILNLLQWKAPGFLPFTIPTWAIVIFSVLARPIIFFTGRYYTKWADKRAAAANGAILAPDVQQSSASIISELIESIQNGYPGEMMLKWNQQYGNIVNINLYTTTAMITNEPEHVKAVLATQFDSFEKGSVFIDQMYSLLGEGVFNADGDMWKFHRAMTRPFFTRERISDFEIYDRNWDLSLKLAKARLAEGYSIDVQDLTSRFTLDSATEFLFGQTVGSLSAGIPYPPTTQKENTPSFYSHPSTNFVKAFTQGLIIAAIRTGLGKEWPLTEFRSDKILPLRKVIDDFTDPLMKLALAKREQDKNKPQSEKEEASTLLSHLVEHTQDPKILKDELVNLLVAGRDTTMCLLTFSIYMLAEHPDIERRLRQEIYEKVGPNEAPKYDQMREMRFMRAFLNEVLRLYPPVPNNARTANKPVVLPAAGAGQKPVYVPRDVACLYTVINIHRRTDLWGPDALKFDPDRFLDERLQKYLVPNPYIFCPFNAGPRICLGQQFAYHEATYYLVRLLQHFAEFTLDMSANVPPPEHWKFGDGLKPTEKIHPTAHLTLYIKGGLWVRMKELKCQSDAI